MDFYCRKNKVKESYSKIYAESHFVLPFSEKKIPKKVIQLLIYDFQCFGQLPRQSKQIVHVRRADLSARSRMSQIKSFDNFFSASSFGKMEI